MLHNFSKLFGDHITCLEISIYRPEPAHVKKKTDHPDPAENLIKPMENSVFCPDKEKTNQEILWLFENLEKAL